MDWLRTTRGRPGSALAMLLGVAELFSLDLVLLMLAVGALVGMVPALAGATVAGAGARRRGRLGRDARLGPPQRRQAAARAAPT